MNKNHNVLFVDDEANILKSLKRIFFLDKSIKVYTAESAEDGEKILNIDNIDIVVSDEKMPHKNGSEFINYVKRFYPDTVRIILTGHVNMESLLNAVNKGEVYRYLLKPWNDYDLKMTIYNAIEYLELKKENNRMKKIINDNKDKIKNLNIEL